MPEKNIKKTVANLTTVDNKNRVGDIVEYEIVLENTSTKASLWEQLNVYDYVPREVSVDLSTIKVDNNLVNNYTIDSNGNIFIPVNDLANGSTSKISFNAKILETAYGKTIMNTAEVEGLQASDPGLYVEKQLIEEPTIKDPDVKDPDIKVPDTDKPVVEKPTVIKPPVQEDNSMKDKSTTSKTSYVTLSKTNKNGVRTYDESNIGILSFLLLVSGGVLVFIKPIKRVKR